MEAGEDPLAIADSLGLSDSRTIVVNAFIASRSHGKKNAMRSTADFA
jgi:hypothetical protein